MNYFVFIMVLAISYSSYNVFNQNNEIARENEDAISIANEINTLSSLQKFENKLNTNVSKNDIVNISSYIVHDFDKSHENITQLTKLKNAMLVAIETTIDPTCNDLVNTGLINHHECEEISSKNFDMFDITSSTVSIGTNDYSSSCMTKVKGILKKNDFSVESNSTLFISPKTTDYNFNKHKLQKKAESFTLVKAEKILNQDNSGELLDVISFVGDNTNQKFKEKIYELSLKRLQKIKTKQQKIQSIIAKQESIESDDDYDSILANKLTPINESLEIKKTNIIENIENTDALSDDLKKLAGFNSLSIP